VYAAEAGSAWTLLYPAYSVAIPQSGVLLVLLAYPTQREAARDLLALLYAWFTEGLDTPDLQEARTLLAAIESAGA
jgi:hypothetical protein